MGGSRRTGVEHQPVLLEAVQREGRDQVGGAAGGDQLRHLLAAGGDRLEAPRTPAGRDQEAVHTRETHDRGHVHRHVTDAGPLAQDRQIP